MCGNAFFLTERGQRTRVYDHGEVNGVSSGADTGDVGSTSTCGELPARFLATVPCLASLARWLAGSIGSPAPAVSACRRSTVTHPAPRGALEIYAGTRAAADLSPATGVGCWELGTRGEKAKEEERSRSRIRNGSAPALLVHSWGEWKEQAGLPMTRPEFSAAKDIFELPLSLVRFGDSSLNFVRISSKNQTSLGGTPYGSFAFLQDHRWMDPRASRCGLRGCTAPPVQRPELCLELEALVCV